MAFTDSQTIQATVASTSETEVGSVQVAAGRQFTITGLYGGHSSGGTYRIKVNTYPTLQGVYLQNNLSGISMAAAANGNIYRTNLVLLGPCTITGYVTNATNSSAKAGIMFNYIDSAQGVTN